MTSSIENERTKLLIESQGSGNNRSESDSQRHMSTRDSFKEKTVEPYLLVQFTCTCLCGRSYGCERKQHIRETKSHM